MSRRGLLAATAMGMTGLAAEAAAQTPQTSAAMPAPAGPKGPPVWRDLDQQALDDAYDQSKYAANIQQVQRRYAANSESLRRRIGAPRRFSYGDSEIEGLDLYPAARANAPIAVFVHGGAWRAGLARDYGFVAEPFVRAGAHCVVLDFVNVTQTDGNLFPMLDQIRRGIAWVGKNAGQFSGDAGRIYLSGHSSGAHLAGVALITDWAAAFGLPPDLIKGALLCSGMYDLAPVRLSARSKYVRFTDAMEDALSTQRHLDRIGCPVVLAHGTLETPEFQRQTRDFAAALQAAGKPAQLLVGEYYNHFEILETLANPYGLLGRAALAQMRLG